MRGRRRDTARGGRRQAQRLRSPAYTMEGGRMMRGRSVRALVMGSLLDPLAGSLPFGGGLSVLLVMVRIIHSVRGLPVQVRAPLLFQEHLLHLPRRQSDHPPPLRRSRPERSHSSLAPLRKIVPPRPLRKIAPPRPLRQAAPLRPLRQPHHRRSHSSLASSRPTCGTPCESRTPSTTSYSQRTRTLRGTRSGFTLGSPTRCRGAPISSTSLTWSNPIRSSIVGCRRGAITSQSSARHQPVISQSSASHHSQSSASHQPVICQSSASHQPISRATPAHTESRDEHQHLTNI